MSNGEKVVNDFESGRFRRVVYGGYVRNHGIFGSCMVFQEGDDGKDAGRGNVYSEFIFPDRELLNVGGERGEEVLAVVVKGSGFFCIFVGRVNDRSIEFPPR